MAIRQALTAMLDRQHKTLEGRNHLNAYIFVRGILGNSDSGTEWTDRADEFCKSFGIHAHMYEYNAGPLTRRFKQQTRARAVAALIKNCDALNIVAMGHSNGADILLRTIKLGGRRIERLYLVAGACDERFDVNGLNDMLRAGRVGKVHVWVSKHDHVLATWGRWSKLFRWIGLGYGTLGLDGPQNVAADVRDRVFVREFPNFDHSTYVEGVHLENTIHKILRTSQYES